MKYILSMIGDESSWSNQTPDEMQATIERVEAFNRAITDAGVWVSAEGMQELSSAKTVRFAAGSEPVVSDGPFSDAKDQVGGFWIIECASIDEALEWARKAPMDDGAIEVRPLASE
jgi:hypothetical protein